MATYGALLLFLLNGPTELHSNLQKSEGVHSYANFSSSNLIQDDSKHSPKSSGSVHEFANLPTEPSHFDGDPSNNSPQRHAVFSDCEARETCRIARRSDLGSWILRMMFRKPAGHPRVADDWSSAMLGQWRPWPAVTQGAIGGDHDSQQGWFHTKKTWTAQQKGGPWLHNAPPAFGQKVHKGVQTWWTWASEKTVA